MTAESLARQIMRQFDDIWNAQDVDRVIGEFAADGKVDVRPGLPGMPDSYQGTAQLRRFVQQIMPGFHVDSHDAEARGEQIVWQSAISSDALRQMGLDTVEATTHLYPNRNGKIQRIEFDLPPSTVGLIEGAPDTR